MTEIPEHLLRRAQAARDAAGQAAPPLPEHLRQRAAAGTPGFAEQAFTVPCGIDIPHGPHTYASSFLGIPINQRCPGIREANPDETVTVPPTYSVYDVDRDPIAEYEARHELSVARLDHWASTFRNCPGHPRFTDDELDELSHLLTWAANQINHGNEPAEKTTQTQPEPGLEDVIDAFIDAVVTAADRARSILDRVAERLGDR